VLKAMVAGGTLGPTLILGMIEACHLVHVPHPHPDPYPDLLLQMDQGWHQNGMEYTLQKPQEKEKKSLMMAYAVALVRVVWILV